MRALQSVSEHPRPYIRSPTKTFSGHGTPAPVAPAAFDRPRQTWTIRRPPEHGRAPVVVVHTRRILQTLRCIPGSTGLGPDDGRPSSSPGRPWMTATTWPQRRPACIMSATARALPAVYRGCTGVLCLHQASRSCPGEHVPQGLWHGFLICYGQNCQDFIDARRHAASFTPHCHSPRSPPPIPSSPQRTLFY